MMKYLPVKALCYQKIKYQDHSKCVITILLGRIQL
jgi:hypothetical protein